MTNKIEKIKEDLELEKNKDDKYFLKEKFFLDNGFKEKEFEKISRLNLKWEENKHQKAQNVYNIGGGILLVLELIYIGIFMGLLKAQEIIGERFLEINIYSTLCVLTIIVIIGLILGFLLEDEKKKQKKFQEDLLK